jgi:hypothetical protein
MPHGETVTRPSVLRRPVEPTAPTSALPPVDIRDEVFDLASAAAFLKVSETWLHESDAPRASLAQQGRPRGPVRFLRSQLLAWLLSRHLYTIGGAPEVPRE